MYCDKLVLHCSLSVAQFVVEPISVTMAEGLETVFECQYQGEEGLDVTYEWAINNSLVTGDTPTVRFRLPPSIGGIATLTILATPEHNESVIQCGVDVRDGLTNVRSAASAIAILVIQSELHTCMYI